MRVVVALVVAAVLGVACRSNERASASARTAVTASKSDIPADLWIEMERASSFGTCPTYTVTIDANGRVAWNGRTNVRVEGLQSAQVSVESVHDLLAHFEAIDFTSLHDTYDIAASDVPSAHITLHRRGKSTRVSVRGTAWLMDGTCRALVWDEGKPEEIKQLSGVHVFDDLDREPPSAAMIEHQKAQDRAEYGPTFVALDDLAAAIDRAAHTAQWIGGAPEEQRR